MGVQSLEGRQAIALSSVHQIVGQNFRIQFYAIRSNDLHQKSYWQPLLTTYRFFFLFILKIRILTKLPKEIFGKIGGYI
jgi:hypothetical protein